MEWIEKLVSEMSSCRSDAPSGNHGPVRLTALAMAIDSKRFRREAVKELKDAFRAELNQYIASGDIPANRKHTEEVLHHHHRIDELCRWTPNPKGRSPGPSETIGSRHSTQ